MIQLKNVSKFYYSKGIIASGISKVNLELNIGEFVVITGESGGGKTTLLNVISGLDSYEEGEMYIDGKETSHYLASDFEEYRKKYIGNIFQSFNLVNSYTVYQNIELILLINGYKKEDIKKRVPSIIKRVGLEAYTKTKVSKLSGGQKQRVSIARALAKDTDIIVADEPTGNLDSASAEGIVQLLSEISRDKLVIVVTHNYEQFAPYATRNIKMHDGKVVEDEQISASTEPKNVGIYNTEALIEELSQKEPEKQNQGESLNNNMSSGSKVRLGMRNTFNIFPKFMLLLVVFLFVVVAVTSEYTSFQHQDEEANKLGYNDYFYNYSEDRLVMKKSDNSQFTEDDLKAMRSIANVKSVSANDILLDKELYIEQGDFAYGGFPKTLDEFDDELIAGRMPTADNEVLITGYTEDYYFEKDRIKDILDKEYTISVGESKEIKVTVVGAAYKKGTNNYYSYTGDMFMSSALMSDLLEETYNYNSKITTMINGKAQEYSEGSPLYRIVPNGNVAQGKALVSEEVNNFYDKGDAKGKTITVTAENMYYTQEVSLSIADTYAKKTFESKTGLKDYDAYNGNIYVNPADYDTLFKKGNYQSTLYVNDVKEIENTTDALAKMGFVPLTLKDTLISYGDMEIISIIQVPMAIIIVLALFFIAYFVIRLILRSRAGYFSILRMLGLAKKSIRRILDVELFTIINIAYLLFLAAVVLVNRQIINVEYISTLVEYMKVTDYVILYAILVFMAYLISGKFARSLFKKTAMGSYREEE